MTTTDPIDRMIEILDGFEVHADENGEVELEHGICRTWLAGQDDYRLGMMVRGAIMHAGECPGPPAPVEEPTAKPCGGVHTGPCEILDREETPDGVWLTYRHEDGEGRVFSGEIE